MTRSGKSTLARALFLSAAAPRLVIDPADSSLTAIPGAVTFSDPLRPPAEAATARFVPTDPADRDAYDAVARWVFAHYPRYVWIDEPEHAAPAAGFPRWINTMIVQGAKRQIGVLTCATRPRHVLTQAKAMAAHVFVFELPMAEDRRHLAENTGVPLALLEEQLAALPRYGFLHWDQAARTLQPFDPLRAALHG